MIIEYTKEEWLQLESKPFPNEHAARLKDPKQYIRFRRENNKFGSGIDAIWGIKKEDGKEVAELQSIRFDKKKFTVKEAQKWLKDHKHQPISFEAASGKDYNSSDNRQYKSFPFEYEIKEDEGIFEGYASTFGNKDAGEDIVEPGAFKKTIKEFKKRIKVLFQHMRMMPIGKPLHLEEDSKGLFTVTKMSMTTLGKDVWTLLKDKVITELSIGYDPIKKSEDEDGTRHLHELKLWEYSPVTWAMNDLAEITHAKSEKEMETMLFGLNSFLHKEGRVLSNKNLILVKDAIVALQALLKATEQEDPNAIQKPPDADDKSLIDEVMEPLNELNSSLKGQKIAQELREFSKKLKER